MKYLNSASFALSFSGLSIIGMSLLLSSASHEAHAKNGISLELRQSGVFDTNPLMRSDNASQDIIRGMETTASVVFSQRNNNQIFNTTLSVKRNQFDVSEYNATDFFWKLNTKKETGRWIWGMNSSLDYDTPRTADESTLGQLALSDRRFAFSISPSVIYKFNHRKSFGLNTRWIQKHYSDGSTLTSHQTQTISPFLSFQLTRNDTTSFALQYQRYASLEAPSLDVNSIGPFVTWQRQMSANTLLEASFGLLGTRYSGIGQPGGWEINPIYSLKLQHTGTRNIASISINRARQALTNGTETDITTAKIKNEYAISPIWDLDLQSEYKMAKQSALSSDDLDNSYSASVRTEYNISRQMQLAVSYKYAKENYISSRDQATRNILRASLDYNL
ncbi:MAG: hypothetical protein ACRBDL_00805 [Alphaproteobacteria bacterium]